MQADEDFLYFPYTTYLTEMEPNCGDEDEFEKEGGKLLTKRELIKQVPRFSLIV
jgi:hypothetical protein